MTDRYVVHQIPGRVSIGVWDRLAESFLPSPDGIAYGIEEAHALAASLNTDPLGHVERHRREQVAWSLREVFTLIATRFLKGHATLEALREARAAADTAAGLAEEGKNIQ